MGSAEALAAMVAVSKAAMVAKEGGGQIHRATAATFGYMRPKTRYMRPKTRAAGEERVEAGCANGPNGNRARHVNRSQQTLRGATHAAALSETSAVAIQPWPSSRLLRALAQKRSKHLRPREKYAPVSSCSTPRAHLNP